MQKNQQSLTTTVLLLVPSTRDFGLGKQALSLSLSLSCQDHQREPLNRGKVHCARIDFKLVMCGHHLHFSINVQDGEINKCVCRFVTEIYDHERETWDPIDP
jgi:hypothetical protein